MKFLVEVGTGEVFTSNVKFAGLSTATGFVNNPPGVRPPDEAP